MIILYFGPGLENRASICEIDKKPEYSFRNSFSRIPFDYPVVYFRNTASSRLANFIPMGDFQFISQFLCSHNNKLNNKVIRGSTRSAKIINKVPLDE